MENWKIKLAVGTLLLTLLVTGCGAANNTAAGENALTGNAAGVQSTGTASAPNGQQGEDAANMPDMIAKVAAASADSIVVLKSTAQPSQMPGGGVRGRQGAGGRAPAGDGQSAPGGGTSGSEQTPSEGATPENGQAASGGAQRGDTTGAQGDRLGGGKGVRPAGGFQMEFAADQTTIPLNADTTINEMTRGEGGPSESQLQASDLKEGDIVMIWLADDGKTALTIRKQQFGQGNRGKAGSDQ
ncbi:hypothetical protein ACFOLF_24975 [Paenibacillus sepulcri]